MILTDKLLNIAGSLFTSRCLLKPPIDYGTALLQFKIDEEIQEYNNNETTEKDPKHFYFNNELSSIKSFYANQTILVTGGTGFIGKVLIEKLLRSCLDIKRIYVLIRPKKGLSTEQRYRKFTENQIFDRIRSLYPDQMSKLVWLSGDISQNDIGLIDGDRQKIIDQVNIVFHSAATVRFDQDLQSAINLNALGSQRLWDLCLHFKNLLSIIHVSTAFTNPCLSVIKETVYVPDHQFKTEEFLKCMTYLPEHIVKMIANHIQGSHPNTYTFTKSIAEQIALSYYNKLPITIVRPSIVTAAVQEPYPGWVDNVNGITGIMMEIGRGTISSIMGDGQLIMELIPVDIVSNIIITAAWYNSYNRSAAIRVYNCSTGSLNPIRWQQYGDYTLKTARIYPSKYIMLYPNFSYRTNRFIHTVFEIFFHFLPAILFDICLWLKGDKPIMFKIARRYKAAADTGEFFAMHDWKFHTRNLRELMRAVSTAKDGADYPCDVRSLKWGKYIEDYMLGIRKYILKDDCEKSLRRARITLKKFYVIKKFFQILLLTGLAYFFIFMN